jgi:hypothetical protein
VAAGALNTHPRAQAMARRLERSAARAGLAADDVARVVRAFHDALTARAELAATPEHFAYLHPGRNVLILLEDLDVRSVELLVAAAALAAAVPPTSESGATPEAAATGGSEEAVRMLTAAGEAGAAHLVEEAVRALVGEGADDDSSLEERLLACSADARLLLLVDRLDRVRHLHLDKTADAAAVHTETVRAFLPLADRTHPLLARRFAWWARTFARRFL